MSFIMTSEITIGDYKAVKPHKVTWKTDINNFVDTCVIELPRITYLKTLKQSTEDINQPNEKKEYVFKEGDKVDVMLGYNLSNYKRFSGFIRRVVQDIPVRIECEGYCYELYDVMFTKSYASTTAKDILADLTKGTGIVLSKEIPHIPLKNVPFKNASGIQVLEWFKKECKLAVYFNFNELYVGTLYGKPQKTVKLRLGWNTIDDDLKPRLVDKNVRIVIKEKNPAGTIKRTKSAASKYTDEKLVKIRAGLPSKLLKEIANRLQTKSNYEGYEGKVKTFLIPYAHKGMVAEVDGYKYPEKSGSFFIESISGEFGPSGGRQNIELGFIVSKDNGYTGTN